MVAKTISAHLSCEFVTAEDNPDINTHDIVIFVIPNTGDEEIVQPMENYLLGLTGTCPKQYAVCELGNYFGFENYCGCKKVAFKILDTFNWTLFSDVSLDSLPKLDEAGLEKWLVELDYSIKALSRPTD